MTQPWCKLGLRLVLRGHVGPLQHPDSQAHTEKEKPSSYREQHGRANLPPKKFLSFASVH